MKLSEAIRLGAMLRPQWFGEFNFRTDGNTSCALQAALESIGRGKCLPRMHDEAEEVWPWIKEQVVQCPVCTEDIVRDVSCIIGVHLNDRHRWTRDRIADWVATIEPSLVLSIHTPLEVAHERLAEHESSLP